MWVGVESQCVLLLQLCDDELLLQLCDELLPNEDEDEDGDDQLPPPIEPRLDDE